MGCWHHKLSDAYWRFFLFFLQLLLLLAQSLPVSLVLSFDFFKRLLEFLFLFFGFQFFEVCLTETLEFVGKPLVPFIERDSFFFYLFPVLVLLDLVDILEYLVVFGMVHLKSQGCKHEKFFFWVSLLVDDVLSHCRCTLHKSISLRSLLNL